MKEIEYRKAEAEDIFLYYEWANDEEVRKCSYQQNKIIFEDHSKWFEKKINDPKSLLLIFFLKTEGEAIGQVRITLVSDAEAIIGISIDKKFRGYGFSSKMIESAVDHYHSIHPNVAVYAYIKKDNISSQKSFQCAGFIDFVEITYLDIPSYRAVKHDKDRTL